MSLSRCTCVEHLMLSPVSGEFTNPSTTQCTQTPRLSNPSAWMLCRAVHPGSWILLQSSFCPILTLDSRVCWCFSLRCPCQIGEPCPHICAPPWEILAPPGIWGSLGWYGTEENHLEQRVSMEETWGASVNSIQVGGLMGLGGTLRSRI